jgi:hypothetical protein
MSGGEGCEGSSGSNVITTGAIVLILNKWITDFELSFPHALLLKSKHLFDCLGGSENKM